MAQQLKSVWGIIRDILIAGGFILMVMTFWNTATFVQKINDFIESQKDCHITINKTIDQQGSDINVLKEWKVATTGKPFRGENP